MCEITTLEHRTPIEILLGVDSEGKTTARKLYEFLELAKGQFSRWAKTNIIENTFVEDGVDYWGFDVNVEGNIVQDYKLTSAFAKKLSIMAKNEKGEEAREYFISVEETTKKIVSTMKDLSPELRLLITMELKQRQQEKDLLELKEQSHKTASMIDDIRDVVGISAKSWREETGNILKRIALGTGGGTAYSQIRTECYELLESRMAVDLKRRLINKRRRMADEGISRTARDKISYVDVIADDKKLVEGFIAIVKELAIKYGT